ncbi:MAG: hypothetical protein H5T69_19000, partial [Chloroflexi bacterium]|nr:hypothetical protein [Chloroflexota bacterium]
GQRLQLVVKNSRVGEDVPLDTHTLYEFLRAEFNSPWEEFALVMELREGAFGPPDISIKTQLPLAIYVPPERVQLRHTGRSRHKIQKIVRRHPGIDLDILRQYKLVYQWIEGLDIVQAFREIGLPHEELVRHLRAITNKVIADLRLKGFIVADMKPDHIIIGEEHVQRMRALGDGDSEEGRARQCEYLHSVVEKGEHSIVDYELLMRTPEHEQQDKGRRRSSYLYDQCERFKAAPVPPFLMQSEIMGVPYVHGHAESTGGLLWVVGRNAHLFDYFLPERWRRTPARLLSSRHEVYDTVTKDDIHIVWRVSRVGEEPKEDEGGERAALIREYGFNSPFEEFAIAHDLNANGVPTVYIRAIYRTGSLRTEPVVDPRRFETHRDILAIDGLPILRKEHNYITIRGFYNGPDEYVATHDGHLYLALDLPRAERAGILGYEEVDELLEIVRARLRNIGYDGTLLEKNDILIACDENGKLIRDRENLPEMRICNLELIHKL